MESESPKGCNVGYGVSGVSETNQGMPYPIRADYTGTLTIPEAVEGYTVYTIPPGAFAGHTGITAVNIPSGVW